MENDLIIKYYTKHRYGAGNDYKNVHMDFGALILEHVSEIMADTCNVSTRQKNK